MTKLRGPRGLGLLRAPAGSLEGGEPDKQGRSSPVGRPDPWPALHTLSPQGPKSAHGPRVHVSLSLSAQLAFSSLNEGRRRAPERVLGAPHLLLGHPALLPRAGETWGPHPSSQNSPCKAGEAQKAAGRAVTWPLHAAGLTVAGDSTGPWCAADILRPTPHPGVAGREAPQALRKGLPQGLRPCSEGWGLPPPGLRGVQCSPQTRHEVCALLPCHKEPLRPTDLESASALRQEPWGRGSH